MPHTNCDAAPVERGVGVQRLRSKGDSKRVALRAVMDAVEYNACTLDELSAAIEMLRSHFGE